jgi:hypothetical protein
MSEPKLNDQEYSVYVCPLKNCQKYLEKPIVLPCGHSICQQHVDHVKPHLNTFDCSLCEQKHPIPEKGFTLNLAISKGLFLNKHLNAEHKEAMNAFQEVESLIEGFKKSDLASPDTFIFEQFFIWRNQIDLHREKMIESIQKKSETLLNKLNALEEECKQHRQQLAMLKFDESDEEVREALRNPQMSVSELVVLKENLVAKIQEIKGKIKIESSFYFCLDQKNIFKSKLILEK